MKNRKQRVGLNGQWSRWRGRVPPGSVLGPVLFGFFTNDLETDRSTEGAQLADDTTFPGGESQKEL